MHITYVANRCILCQYCYFVLPQEQEKCGGGGCGGGGCGPAAAGCRLRGVLGGRPARAAGPAALAASQSRHTRANPHELASNGSCTLFIANEECTRTCCCRACWNVTGSCQEQPGTLQAGMDPAEIYINMQRISSYV